MSILIKGMEMPKNCDSCPCYYETEGAWRNECEVLQREHYITDERPDWCPLVSVPKHGDLIDADKLVELCDIMADKCDGIGASIWHQFKTTVEWSPIVIPAEEGET